MTNMTNTKPGVIETNDFGYYMQLKKQDQKLKTLLFHN